ncbi:MAG: MBOAT family protein [Lachnospiraceae bacterium]|nr:MBOAT family protein [Lachnospiraceae bacterium]
MLFHSFFFLFVFLPLTIIGWHFLSAFKNRAVSEWFLIVMSLWFYALFGKEVLALLLICTALGFLFHRLLWLARSAMQMRILLAASTVIYLLILFWYKLHDGVLPVGLSFYLFQMIAFLAERAKGNLADISPREYLLYVFYFPKLAQGPIALPAEIIEQFRTRERKHIDYERILRGLMLFIFGLAKKVLLADALSPVVNFGFAQTAYLDTATILLVLFSYAFQLYFDFSGYCDMAMGISRMLGVELPVNFDAPFQAQNLRDFWKRWHMTLSRFLTRYVYIPLGGSRRGQMFTYFNILLVFVLSGLWHGTGATYLLWGLINGLFVAVSHGLAKREKKKPQPEGSGKSRLFARVRVFAAFLFTLVFFRSESVKMAFVMLRRFLLPLYPGFLLRTAANLNLSELYPVTKALSFLLPGMENQVLLVFWILILILCFILIRKKNAYEIAATAPLTMKRALGMGVLFAWSMLAFNNVNSFLYFAY